MEKIGEDKSKNSVRKQQPRGSLFSFFEMKESLVDTTNQEDKRFYFDSPIQSILTKFCENSINDYVFHTKIYLEYDEENAFVFIFSNSLVFTHIFDEKTVYDNPILYIIKFQQVIALIIPDLLL